jgi:hypothetical protein
MASHATPRGCAQGDDLGRQQASRQVEPPPPSPTTTHVWFFDILFMSKYMKLLSQLKIYDFKLTKIQTSKNQRHKVIM